jgi:hypothetical protein
MDRNEETILMTIEQRLESVEQQNQQILQQNRRFKIAFTVLAVALCGLVTLEDDIRSIKYDVDVLIHNNLMRRM